MNIPGYQIGREISTGEYCSVYNAIDIQSSKTVTIKFFHPQLSTNPDFCQYLKKISEALSNKTIGIIVPVKAIHSSPDGCYIITDYFPCGNNNQPLKTEFTVDEILNFGLQMAESLNKLHALGLIHGAVSTSNLIFPNLSQVTLGMMSFQRTLQLDASVSPLPITMDEAIYIAPEFNSKHGLDTKSDFYSLGIVLYELLFKKQPFVANDFQELLSKKQTLEFADPDIDLLKLQLLFAKLLAPNPSNRIHTAEDYIKVVQQCGYDLATISGKTDVSSKPEQLHSEPEESTDTEGGNKNIIYISVAAGFLILVVVSFFIFGTSTEKKKKPVTNNSISSTVEQPESRIHIPQPDEIISDSKSKNSNIAQELYLNGKKQLELNNYGAALMSINNALKEQPDHAEALKIKKEIELEFEVRAYLSRAEKLIQEGKLTQPEDNNAFKTYSKLATILPAGDNRALQGLQNIANRYYAVADEQVLNKNYEEARQTISKGLMVLPDHTELKQLDLYVRLEETKKLTQIEQKQQEIELNKQKEAAQQALIKQQAEEKNKLAAIEREKALQLKQQQELEKDRQIQQKRLKIDDLLHQAQTYLEPNQLSLQSLDKSLITHQKLTALAPDEPKVNNLFTQIINSYRVLANRQKNIPNYAEALKTINQGLALDKNNANLTKLKNEINQLVSKSEQEQNEVPFIGTF